jgi:hypothetical protein
MTRAVSFRKLSCAVLMSIGAALVVAHDLEAAGDLDPRLALHIVPDVGALPCEDPSLTDLRCETIRVVGDTTTVQRLYLVVTGMPDGIRGFWCGIHCGGGLQDTLTVCRPEGVTAHVYSATGPCESDVIIEFIPSLPARGPDGLVVVGYWEIAKGSWGYVYTGGTIGGAGSAHVIDLTGDHHVLPGSFWELFGLAALESSRAEYAYNPCEPLVPIAETSWGQIKALYR